MSLEAKRVNIVAVILRAVRLFTLGLFTMVGIAVSVVTIIILTMGSRTDSRSITVQKASAC